MAVRSKFPSATLASQIAMADNRPRCRLSPGAQSGPPAPVQGDRRHDKRGQLGGSSETKERTAKVNKWRYGEARDREWDSVRCCMVSAIAAQDEDDEDDDGGAELRPFGSDQPEAKGGRTSTSRATTDRQCGLSNSGSSPEAKAGRTLTSRSTTDRQCGLSNSGSDPTTKAGRTSTSRSTADRQCGLTNQDEGARRRKPSKFFLPDDQDLGESPSIGEMAIRGGEEAEVPAFHYQQTGKLSRATGPYRRGRWGISVPAAQCQRQTAYAIPQAKPSKGSWRISDQIEQRERKEDYAAFCAFAEQRQAQCDHTARSFDFTHDQAASFDVASVVSRLQQRRLEFSPDRGTSQTRELRFRVGAVYRDLGEGADGLQDQTKDLWTKLGLEDSAWAKRYETELRTCVTECARLFEFTHDKPAFVGVDGREVEVPIHLTDEVPVAQRAYRLPPAKLAVLDKYLDELLELKVIRPTSTSSYSSVVVLVPKGDGTQRVTCNFAPLNRKIKKYAFSPVTPQDIFDCCCGCEMFSTLDVTKAFYNLKVKPTDVHKTAFATPHRGMFEWLRLPMGLVNSPADLAAAFENMFRVPLPSEFGSLAGKMALGTVVSVYCDDILIHTSARVHHTALMWVMRTLHRHK